MFVNSYSMTCRDKGGKKHQAHVVSWTCKMCMNRSVNLIAWWLLQLCHSFLEILSPTFKGLDAEDVLY